MGFFDDIFGGFFDFNGDGKTTLDEQWIAYKIMQDVDRETKKENSYNAPFYDDDEFESYMDELEKEFDEAVGQDEIEATEVAINVPITLNFSIEFPALDDIDAIKESDYPNKRTYKAAVRKFSLETGLVLGLNKAEKTKAIEQCDFLMNNYNKCIAAKYLTTDYGEFLYAQAVKENFNLPFDLPDEDEQTITPLDDLFKQIHSECKEQLFPIWKWLIENFVPYMQYSSDNGYKLSTGMIFNCCFIDDNFIYELADYVSKNKAFGKLVIELSPSLNKEYGTLFALLLQKRQIDFAKQLFTICTEKNIDSAHINGVIFGLMECCSNYKELETMELFEQHIFPIVKAIDRADVKSIVSAWEDEIRNYYTYCKENFEQYLTHCNEKKSKLCDYSTSDNLSSEVITETLELRRDKTIYTYVGVLFPYATHHYHYLTDDDTITIGDSVIVPVGTENKEMVAKVVSVEKHLRISAPFPVEKTKKIIRKNTVADSVPKKLRLISNNICFGPMPDADDEVEQHLTILNDGRMWISRYCFGHGDANKYKLIEKKQITIGKELAKEILSYTKDYFEEKGIIMQCTDVGVWELFLTDENDFKTVILGSLITDDYTSEISKYLRRKLPVSNLLLFDGNVRK